MFNLKSTYKTIQGINKKQKDKTKGKYSFGIPSNKFKAGLSNSKAKAIERSDSIDASNPENLFLKVAHLADAKIHKADVKGGSPTKRKNAIRTSSKA